jgi:hypothetical protein
VKALEGADTQAVLRDVHESIDSTGAFYFATMQVETDCVDTPGADDIDIMAGGGHDGHGSAHENTGHDVADEHAERTPHCHAG